MDIQSIDEIRDKFLIQPIQKIAFIQSPDYMSLTVDRIRDDTPEGYHVLRVGEGWTEIMQDGIDKGSAIVNYAKKKHIDASEIMAFGDSENDLTMLRSVGYPYAMENAMDAILAIENINTTLSNNEEGVAVILEELLASLEK